MSRSAPLLLLLLLFVAAVPAHADSMPLDHALAGSVDVTAGACDGDHGCGAGAASCGAHCLGALPSTAARAGRGEPPAGPLAARLTAHEDAPRTRLHRPPIPVA